LSIIFYSVSLQVYIIIYIIPYFCKLVNSLAVNPKTSLINPDRHYWKKSY